MQLHKILGVTCLGLLCCISIAWVYQAKQEPTKKQKNFPLDDYFLGDPRYFPDGKWIVTRGAQITIWDLKSGKPVRTLDNARDLYCLAISPNGKRILAGSSAGTIGLWNTESGKRIFWDNPNQSWIFHCAFSSDGQMAMTAGSRASPTIWDAREDKFKVHSVCQGHSGGVGSVAFSKDSKLVISAGKEVILWEAPSGKLLRKLDHEKGGTVGFSDDGKSIYCRGRESQVWDLQMFKVISKVALPEKPIPIDSPFCYSPKADLMIWGDNKTDNAIWNALTNRVLRKLEKTSITFDQDYGFQGWDFSPDGKTLVATYKDSFYFWSVESGKLERMIKTERPY
jgi:WD40 repeat protein